MKDIFFCSAIELGQMVNNKEITPTEIIDAYEARIKEVNPKVNAIVYTQFDWARLAAKRIEEKLAEGIPVGPLAGVPVGLKDFLPSKEGWVNSHGGVKSLIAIDAYDSEICKAMEKLGAIVIGKTNAPAFGFRGTTDNELYGPTSTPFNTEYNSGGSSGGSASAVSSGMMTIAEGGDAGGSIRIPAAWCGCFGFKSSAGLIPSVCRPDAWTATHPYCCGGPITRTVDDAALVLSEMIKYDPRDPISVMTPPSLIQNILDRHRVVQRRKYKIAYTFNFGGLFPYPNQEIAEAIDNIINVLSDLGNTVNKANFHFNYSCKAIEEAWLRGISVDSSIDNAIAKANGFDLIGEHSDELPEAFIKWDKIAFESTMMDYRNFHEIRTDILDAHLNVFEDADIIIAPVSGCLPVKNSDDKNTRGPSEIGGYKVDPLIGFAYTYLENMIGYPAASVPIGLTHNNLPIGLQIIGKRYHDDEVFAIARQIESAMPWVQTYSKVAETL